MPEYIVTIPGYTGHSIVEAETASKARYKQWLEISDIVPVRLIDLHVKRVSSPHAANTDTT